MHFLRILFANLPMKLLALLFALFLWGVAALERQYEITLEVPIKVVEKGEKERVITNVDAKNARVTLSGKGKELLRIRRSQLTFQPLVPEGRFGSRQVRLNSADLKLPAGITVRTIEPELVEVKLGPAQARDVKVIVPTKNWPSGGMTITEIRPLSGVKLIGPSDEIENYNTVTTETLDLSRVQSGERRVLRVLVPTGRGFSAVPESVMVEVTLEREAARIFLGLPVKVIAPPTMDISVEPDEAQIAIAGPANMIDSLKTTDITVQIKIASLPVGEHRLGADVLLPPRFRLVKCEPQLFVVTIR